MLELIIAAMGQSTLWRVFVFVAGLYFITTGMAIGAETLFMTRSTDLTTLTGKKLMPGRKIVGVIKPGVIICMALRAFRRAGHLFRMNCNQAFLRSARDNTEQRSYQKKQLDLFSAKRVHSTPPFQNLIWTFASKETPSLKSGERK